MWRIRPEEFHVFQSDLAMGTFVPCSRRVLSHRVRPALILLVVASLRAALASVILENFWTPRGGVTTKNLKARLQTRRICSGTSASEARSGRGISEIS